MRERTCEVLVPEWVRPLVERLKRQEAERFERSARLLPLLDRLSVDEVAAVLEAVGLLDEPP